MKDRKKVKQNIVKLREVSLFPSLFAYITAVLPPV